MTVTSVPLYLFALRIDLRFQVVQYTNWWCTVMAYGWSMAEPMTETTLPWGCKNFTKRWWMINCFPTLYGFVPGVKNRRARKEKKQSEWQRESLTNEKAHITSANQTRATALRGECCNHCAPRVRIWITNSVPLHRPRCVSILRIHELYLQTQTN